MKKLNTFLTVNLGRVASVATALVSFFYVSFANADLTTLTKDNINSNLICPVIKVMFNTLIGIAIVMGLWAAYTYLTAQDDSEKVSKGHKILTYTAVAVAVALIARGFPNLVISIFGDTMASAFCAF